MSLTPTGSATAFPPCRDTRTAYDSPALKYRSEHYPRRGFEGREERVPLRVIVTRRVRSEIPFGPPMLCQPGEEFEVYVNSHGAVSAITPSGLLGLKPGEFTVLTYHPETASKAPECP